MSMPSEEQVDVFLRQARKISDRSMEIEEKVFWQKVYIAAIESPNIDYTAAERADRAVRAYRKRFPPNLGE